MKFSARELQIWDLLRLGQTNKEIALNLGVSATTVRDHLRRMMLRSGLKTRVALAVLYFSKNGALANHASIETERRTNNDRRTSEESLQM